MYTLKVTLCHPDSYEDARWYADHYFKTKAELYNYLELNYSSDLEDPDGRFRFEIYDPNDNLIY